jgi:hypothetical protein
LNKPPSGKPGAVQTRNPANPHDPSGFPAPRYRDSRFDPRAVSEVVVQKLKLGPISDDKPIKLTVEVPAAVHRDLVAYAEALGRETA